MLGSKNILKAALPPFPPAGLCLFLLFFPFVFPLFSPFLWRCDCPTRRAQNSPFPTEISTRGHALFPHPQKEKKPKRNLTQHLQTPILQRKKQRETPRWLKHRPGREEPRGTSSKTWSPPSSNPPPPPKLLSLDFAKKGRKRGAGTPSWGRGAGRGRAAIPLRGRQVARQSKVAVAARRRARGLGAPRTDLGLTTPRSSLFVTIEHELPLEVISENLRLVNKST